MAIEPGSIEHLSQIISHVVAPAFLLGAVASFIATLITRMNGVLDRLRVINELPAQEHAKSKLKADIPRLKRRVALLHRSAILAISSGVVAAVLIIVAFGSALLAVTHVYSAAILFMLSLGLLCGSLVVFGMEVWIGLNEYDHH